MADALFTINADSSDEGFDATTGQVLTLTLKTQPVSGVQSVRFQIWREDDFDPALDIIRNPPRASKLAPELEFDNGVDTGASLAPVTVDGDVTLTMPLTDGHAWIVRCVVNGGIVLLADGRAIPDPALIHERMVVVRDASGRRPIVASETGQYDRIHGWAADVGSGGPTGPTGPTGPAGAAGATGAASAFRRIRTELYRTDGSLETIDENGDSTFTTSSTWAPQSDGHRYRVWVAPGGPGGGRGGRSAAGNLSGVGGSGGGHVSEEWFDRDVIEDVIDDLGTDIPIAVGAGGAAVAAQAQGSGNANAVAGNPGTASSFGELVVAYPGAVGATGNAGPNRGGGGGGIFNAAGGVNFLGGQPQDDFNTQVTIDNNFGGGQGGAENTGQSAGASVTGGGGGGASRTAATAQNGLPGGRSIRGCGGSGASGGAQTAGSARAGGAGGRTGYATGTAAMVTNSVAGVGGGGTAGAAGTGVNAGDGGPGDDGIIGVRGGEGGGGGGGLLVNAAGTFTSGAGGQGGFPGGAGGPSGGAGVNGPGTGAANASGKGGDGVVAVFTYG